MGSEKKLATETFVALCGKLIKCSALATDWDVEGKGKEEGRASKGRG